MIGDLFADILNSENQQKLCKRKRLSNTGLCGHSRPLSSKVTAVRKQNNKTNKTKNACIASLLSGEKDKVSAVYITENVSPWLTFNVF